MKRVTVYVMVVLAPLVLARPASAATLYADMTASGTGDCSSWANACTLPTSISNAGSGDEIWTKAGTYEPITLKSGVTIVGGFAGGESSASQSNPDANPTIIDGGGTQRCIESDSNTVSTALRGFVARNGKDTSFDGGGGILLKDSSARIVDCVFEDNTADWWGGAVSVRGTGSPEFINCIFRNNGETVSVETKAGGAVYIYSGSPKFTNCLFHNNKAGEGAGIANADGSATLLNCTLGDNEATMGNGGGVHDERGDITIRNSILWGNISARQGAQIYSVGNSTTTVTYSDVQGGWGGTGNIDSDPKFVDPSQDDYSLQLLSSPCKEEGQNTSLPTDLGDLDWDGNTAETLPLDLGLDQRTKDCLVDMGAYEIQHGQCGGGIGGIE